MERHSGEFKKPNRADRNADEHNAGRAMGRPRLPANVARSKRISTFVTDREKTKLLQLAAASSLSVSALCHRLIVHGINYYSDCRPENEGNKS